MGGVREPDRIIAFRADWIDQLYVLPDAQRTGAGSALLGIAKAQAASLSLWTFQRNEAARRFYELQVRRDHGNLRRWERQHDILYRSLA